MTADPSDRAAPATPSLADRLRAIGVIPTVEVDDASAAVPLARALLAGGIGCVEVTFRSPAAAQAIDAIRHEVPEILVGAGTILAPDQVDVVLAAGAAFLVSPATVPAVLRRALEAGIPIVPGACTPTEVQAALDAGVRLVKFFPAAAAGGVAYLRALAGPFPDVRFMPTGGIDAANLAEYLAVPSVVACGGSWLARRGWIAAGDFAAVTAAAREAARIVAAARGA